MVSRTERDRESDRESTILFPDTIDPLFIVALVFFILVPLLCCGGLFIFYFYYRSNQRQRTRIPDYIPGISGPHYLEKEQNYPPLVQRIA